MKNTSLLTLPLILCGFLNSSVLSGDTLTSFDFDVPTVSGPSSSATPAFQMDNITVSPMTWVGLGSSTAYGFGGAAQTAYAQGSVLPDAINDDSYATFTLTASDGHYLNLDSITFDLGGTNGHETVARTVFTSIRTDAESTPFSTDIAVNEDGDTLASHVISANTPGSSPTFTTYTISLSGSEYQNLSEITFRIYGAVSNPAGTLFLRYDNIIVEGAVSVIPEPATVGLLTGSLFLGVTLLWRKRRK